MNTPDGSARIPIGRSRNSAGVKHHDSGFRRFGRPHPSPLLELELDGGAVCLGRAAAEIYYLEAGHVSILTQQMVPRRRGGLTPPGGLRHRQTRFALESGKQEEGELASDSGIFYKFSINIRLLPLAVSAGNIHGKIPDAPA